MDVPTCPKCNTPLDAEQSCVTCAAEGEGLKLLSRSGYASVKEMMDLLESDGVSPAMEQVPARRPEEKVHPLWNLYVPDAEVERAAAVLEKDWAHLLGGLDAVAAAARGLKGIDLDAGGGDRLPGVWAPLRRIGGPAGVPRLWPVARGTVGRLSRRGRALATRARAVPAR